MLSAWKHLLNLIFVIRSTHYLKNETKGHNPYCFISDVYETCDESMFHLVKILLIELHQQVFR